MAEIVRSEKTRYQVSVEPRRWMKHHPIVSISILFMVCTAVLWGVSLRQVNLLAMTDTGLMSVLPPSFYAALALLTISFALVVTRQKAYPTLLLLHIVLYIFIIHGSPTILYGTLRYAWAWKHLGIVDYILRYGQVDPTVAYLDAYHNWPGFFALNAYIAEIAGIDTALSYSRWATVFFNLSMIGALLLIVRTFSRDHRVIWLSIWFFYLANWVGQDYFSPQSLAYFLYLVVIGVCLAWFPATSGFTRPSLKRWLRSERLTNFVYSFVGESTTNAISSKPLARVGLMLTIILILFTIASSHQLTPFMTIIALMALVIFRRTSALTLPILMLVISLTWMTFVAGDFLGENLASVVKNIGMLLNNVDSNLREYSNASEGQILVSMMGRGLTLLMGALAGLGGLRRFYNGQRDLTAMLLVIAPFVMLVGNSYGGEILFRVYLFAVPFLAFFTTGLLFPRPAAGRSWLAPVVIVGISSVMLVGFLFAYYGKEQEYYFTQDEVDAAGYLYEIAPEGSLLIEGSRNYPALFKNYERFTYVPISREPWESQQNLIGRPVEVLTRWMSNEDYTAAYFFVTRSQKITTDIPAEIDPRQLGHVEEEIRRSDAFQIIFENEDAVIFMLADSLSEETDDAPPEALEEVAEPATAVVSTQNLPVKDNPLPSVATNGDLIQGKETRTTAPGAEPPDNASVDEPTTLNSLFMEHWPLLAVALCIILGLLIGFKR